MADGYSEVGPDLDDGRNKMGLTEIKSLYERVKSRSAERDKRMQNVLAVRQGRLSDVFPDLFPDGPFANKSIAANMVDVAARDLAEVLAPLPSFNCHSNKSSSDAARDFAEKRTKIINGYMDFSSLQVQMYDAADRYFTYGFVPAMVEIDFDEQMPRIRFMDSIGTYPVFDRWGEISAAFFSFWKSRDELVAMYPHCEGVLGRPTTGNDQIEVVRYHDKHVDMLFLPRARESMVLESAVNPVGECLVEWVKRPGVDADSHGQFDDVLAVQVAKARFALLSLEAAQKAVQAPIVMPPDVQELALGSDAVLRTANGEKVRRVPIEVPQAAFAQQGILDQELRQGSRYPEARNGSVDGSVVTGRGVQALMSGFDTQVRTGQAMFAHALTRLARKCFMVDEALFGAVTKTLRGNAQGTPYEIKYRPDKDLKGDYSVDVQYGLMAGLDPNRALVFGLQARGDRLISREFLMGQLPFSVNPTEEETKINREEMRDALKQAIAGYVQSIPVMAQQGQDPAQAISKVVSIINGLNEGKPIEEVAQEAFEPPEPSETAAAEGVESPDAAGMGLPGEAPPGGGAPAGMDESGRLQGVAPGQAGMAPGGRPDLQQLFAAVGANGQAQMTAGVTRRTPI
jgi:hypothetical protein